MKHFDKALNEIKPSMSKKIIDFYRQFDERFKKKVMTEKKTVEEKELGYVG
jgi:ribosomal protein L16 Arg81 hydroxylase